MARMLEAFAEKYCSATQVFRTAPEGTAWLNRILTDGHAPPQYRASTVRNIDAWYRAFGVTAGQALYLAPGERVRIW